MSKRGAMKASAIALAFAVILSASLGASEAQLVSNLTMNSALAQRTFRNTIPSIVNYSQTAHATSTSAKAGSADAVASLNSAYCSPSSNWVMWDTPFIVSDSRDKDEDTAGLDTTLNGFATGISRMLGENSSIGLAVGYNSGKASDSNRNLWSARSDTFHAAIYGGTAIGCFFVDAYAGYSYDKQRFDNWGATSDATGKFSNTVLSAGLKASYVWILPNEMRIIPSLGLDYTHVRTGSFNTPYAGSTEYINSFNYNMIRMPLAVSVNRTFAANFLSFKGYQSLWTPELRASWTPQFGAKHATLQTMGRSVDSYPRSNSYGTVGAGLKIKLAGKYIFGVDYDYTFASNYRNHTLTGTYGVSF